MRGERCRVGDEIRERKDEGSEWEQWRTGMKGRERKGGRS